MADRLGLGVDESDTLAVRESERVSERDAPTEPVCVADPLWLEVRDCVTEKLPPPPRGTPSSRKQGVNDAPETGSYGPSQPVDDSPNCTVWALNAEGPRAP